MSNSNIERAAAIFAARVPGSKCRLVDGDVQIRCTAGTGRKVEVTFPAGSSDVEMRRYAETLDLRSS
jgi:hypothetical protein